MSSHPMPKRCDEKLHSPLMMKIGFIAPHNQRVLECFLFVINSKVRFPRENKAPRSSRRARGGAGWSLVCVWWSAWAAQRKSVSIAPIWVLLALFRFFIVQKN